MKIDYQQDPLFKSAEERTRAWLRPGSGEASAISQVSASPDGSRAVAAASICDTLEGVPSTRIAMIDLASGDLEILTHGPNSDSAPRWSPDGRTIAYLSDREQPHVRRLRLLDLETGADCAIPAADGFAEWLQWSPDGQSILLGVAGFGSDLAGSQGAFAVEAEATADAPPPWVPAIEGSPEATPWRSAWRYDLASGTLSRITPDGITVWEAAWCGPDHIAAVCSDRPEENWWYGADVRLISLEDGQARRLFKPDDQLGWLTASPSGRTVAVVEAVCSDRNIVAGDVRLIDVAGGSVRRPSTLDADVTQMHWRGDERLIFTAARGPETLVGLLDCAAGQSDMLWQGKEETLTGAMFPEVVPLGQRAEDFLFLRESFFEPPVLAMRAGGQDRDIRRFGAPETDARIRDLGHARDFRWTAPDGLEIHGWLLTPDSDGPHPLIMQVHGGPVWFYRPSYVGRSAFLQLAIEAGYAVFLPNPRGSSGRGQDFARHVFGDMGGADAHDFLSGLDALEQAGIADGTRIGVTGGSYGGYISSWIITQDSRFAAAVPVAPIGNWVSQRLTCNIPDFCDMFLADEIGNLAGKYYSRSPIQFADRARTPTFQICGALDRITPPGQALEFHRALLGHGVETMLATYPLEGHGVRTMPALFDYTARLMSWFERHMSAKREITAGNET